MSHLHADHTGGALLSSPKASYPNAAAVRSAVLQDPRGPPSYRLKIARERLVQVQAEMKMVMDELLLLQLDLEQSEEREGEDAGGRASTAA
ncbi:hypothetical protein MNEG_1809 [Monoraphidium neglectum]|uniref:Uncharacterized protein n=1 Tax=Monoraphidium neglectum TaxID=145388 RepID=A0A0D2LI90_9CHLO|nr:hypothetical protein MNEG_1809 [Monoraphidium neglectum]KIZ06144.1 hypothetical protein MNEG_1809 [Monoraphidium neglectum]|eukprot:XP_013905163.1 hypothetical protein MNEG_1809 [Monoraphidium neglectum]